MKTKIKIRNWILFTEIGINAVPYILEFKGKELELNDDEIALCIQEQVYGEE